MEFFLLVPSAVTYKWGSKDKTEDIPDVYTIPKRAGNGKISRSQVTHLYIAQPQIHSFALFNKNYFLPGSGNGVYTF